MGMQWYIIHTYSGFEKKVKESLESRVEAFSLQDKIGRVLIPMEEVVEVRGGKKVVSNRMSYPGYVLVEMDLDENTWHIVRATPRVTGFVGSATSPSPLTEAEVDGIINRVHTPQDRRTQRASAHRGRPVCEFQRQRGRDRQRSQPLESFGDDFRALDSGGIGFRERREAGISRAKRE
jgi:transcriptional antiterminator NusG